MKLIVAGGRGIACDWTESPLVPAVVEEFLGWAPPTIELVSGGAEGVDRAAERWAEAEGLFCKRFPADWEQHGKAAGPIRNRQMAEYADALLLIWDGQSRGSASMKREMQKLGKPIYEVILRKENA